LSEWGETIMTRGTRFVNRSTSLGRKTRKRSGRSARAGPHLHGPIGRRAAVRQAGLRPPGPLRWTEGCRRSSALRVGGGSHILNEIRLRFVPEHPFSASLYLLVFCSCAGHRLLHAGRLGVRRDDDTPVDLLTAEDDARDVLHPPGAGAPALSSVTPPWRSLGQHLHVFSMSSATESSYLIPRRPINGPGLCPQA